MIIPTYLILSLEDLPGLVLERLTPHLASSETSGLVFASNPTLVPVSGAAV